MLMKKRRLYRNAFIEIPPMGASGWCRVVRQLVPRLVYLVVVFGSIASAWLAQAFKVVRGSIPGVIATISGWLGRIQLLNC